MSINITVQQRNTPKTNQRGKKSDAKVANREKSFSKNKKDLEESRRDSDKKIDVFFQTYRKSLDQLYADVM
jgi:sorbitol-specific phosphotransferase system component IIBC